LDFDAVNSAVSFPIQTYQLGSKLEENQIITVGTNDFRFVTETSRKAGEVTTFIANVKSPADLAGMIGTNSFEFSVFLERSNGNKQTFLLLTEELKRGAKNGRSHRKNVFIDLDDLISHVC
jgi:hypothetical protein